jgi:hypothetical protein
MRAETQQQTPEIFENKITSSVMSSSTQPKSEVDSPSVATPLPISSPMQEAPKVIDEQVSQIKYTEDDILLEFQGDVLSVYDQSSGTVSYDSFAPTGPETLESIKVGATWVSFSFDLFFICRF